MEIYESLSVGQIIERGADRVPDKIAVVDGEQRKTYRELNAMADALSTAIDKLEPLARDLTRAAASETKKGAFAYAHPFLKVTGDIIMAWMLLWRANVASKALADKPAAKDLDFYQGIIQTAEYYIHSQLPTALGKMDGIQSQNSAMLDIADSCLG